MSMKAVQLLGPQSSPRITLSKDLPAPSPKGTELLIRVHAAGITADEVSWPELYKTPSRIPGHDISGIIASLGPDYAGPFSVGDEVFAMLHADRGQGQAEYAVAADEEVALKPKSISHAEAAALPIPVLTAFEALTKYAKLEKGARILVTGASGAVGVMLMQLARKMLDAEVVALASLEKHEYLRGLGAAEVVDYNTPGWEESIASVDAVFDTVGGSTLSRSWKVIKSQGSLVTVADPPPTWALGQGDPVELKAKPGVRYKYFVLSPDSGAMLKVAKMIDDVEVVPLPVVVFPVSEAVAAWDAAGKRGRKGKIVIDFA
ncbi:zinc-containing alcohol dehydrogenase [Cladorrhinum sp. PSN259]|nr:zinc-containing alcohol dehydrogenase [Cladorrhinum sp. PSN259]